MRSHRHHAQVICGAARQTGYTISETAPQTSEHVMSPVTTEFHVSNITNYSIVFIVSNTATITIHQNQYNETALLDGNPKNSISQYNRNPQ